MIFYKIDDIHLFYITCMHFSVTEKSRMYTKMYFSWGDAIMEGFDYLLFLYFQTYTCVIIRKGY